MAKRKKGNSNMGAVPMEMPRERSVNIGIREAENGYVVNASCEGGKEPGYQSKTYIASTHPQAVQIANTHMQSIAGGKKARGKKAKRKIAVAKR